MPHRPTAGDILDILGCLQVMVGFYFEYEATAHVPGCINLHANISVLMGLAKYAQRSLKGWPLQIRRCTREEPESQLEGQSVGQLLGCLSGWRHFP